MRSSAFIGLLALLVGCMGPTFIVQQYAGAVRPSASIAILRVNGKDPVRLMTLDDQDVAAPVIEDGRLHIEILPGRHRLSVKNAAIPSEPAALLVVEAEAAKVYRVAYGPEARIFEVDRDSDRALRDVTVDPALAPPVLVPTVAPPAPPEEPAPLPPVGHTRGRAGGDDARLGVTLR